MTLLLREVAALVFGAAVWLVVVAVAAAVPAFVFAAARRRRPAGRELRGAVGGGLLIAAALARFGLDDPLGLAVLRRPLPLTWVLVGAAAGTLIAARRPRRVAITDRAAG